MYVGDLVLVHDKTLLRSYWKMGKVNRLLMRKDGQSGGAEVRVEGRGSSGGGPLRRSLQLLYPLEAVIQMKQLLRSKYLNHRNSRHKVKQEEIESGEELQSRESE